MAKTDDPYYCSTAYGKCQARPSFAELGLMIVGLRAIVIGQSKRR
jgi:hypothetical protein